MSASDLAESAGPTVAEILAKLGTDSKTGLNSVQLHVSAGVAKIGGLSVSLSCQS